MGTIFVDNIKQQSSQGSGTITIGASGETVALASGVKQSNLITPAFLVKLSSNYNIATGTPTKLQYTTEVFDTDNAFDNSTNYRFTVPSGKAGKYFLYHQARANGWGAGRFVGYIYVNGSVDTATAEMRTTGASYPSVDSSIVLDLDVGDYVEHYIYHDQGGTQALQGFSTEHQSTTYFGGYRIGT